MSDSANSNSNSSGPSGSPEQGVPLITEADIVEARQKGRALALGIGFSPGDATLIATATLRKRFGSSALREGVVQIVGAAPALVALLDRDLAAYHGVEHKAIAAYEQGIDDPAGVPKEHDRCGSNLITPMMLLSVGGTVMLERLVEKPSPAARAVVGLAGASIAVEMFAWSDRHSDTALARAFHTPGHEIQRLIATREPTPEQLEVGVAALAEILRVENAASSDEQPATSN